MRIFGWWCRKHPHKFISLYDPSSGWPIGKECVRCGHKEHVAPPLPAQRASFHTLYQSYAPYPRPTKQPDPVPPAPEPQRSTFKDEEEASLVEEFLRIRSSSDWTSTDLPTSEPETPAFEAGGGESGGGGASDSWDSSSSSDSSTSTDTGSSDTSS